MGFKRALHCGVPFSDSCIKGSRRQCVCSRENGVVSLDEGILSKNLKDVGLERKERNNAMLGFLAQTMK